MSYKATLSSLDKSTLKSLNTLVIYVPYDNKIFLDKWVIFCNIRSKRFRGWSFIILYIKKAYAFMTLVWLQPLDVRISVIMWCSIFISRTKNLVGKDKVRWLRGCQRMVVRMSSLVYSFGKELARKIGVPKSRIVRMDLSSCNPKTILFSLTNDSKVVPCTSRFM